MRFTWLILIFGALLLAACSDPLVCVDDNVCTAQERLIGTCSDCAADLSLGEVETDIWQEDDGSYSAWIRVEVNNPGADPNERILLSAEFQGRTETNYVWLNDRLEIETEIEVREGVIDPFIWVGDDREYAGVYFSNIDVDGFENFVLTINADEAVSESNYNNNEVRGAVDLSGLRTTSQYLIESNIPFGDDVVEYVSTEFSQQSQAKLEVATYWTTGQLPIQVGVFHEYDETFVADVLEDIEEAGASIIDVGEYKIYQLEGDVLWVWFSGDIIVLVEGNDNGLTGPYEALVEAYTSKHTPDPVLVVPDPQEFCGDGIVQEELNEVCDPGHMNNALQALFVQLNQPLTLEVDGRLVEFEIVGGNSDANNGDGTITLSVNGERVTAQEGEIYSFVGDVEVIVRDLFVTNIPVLDASATLLVGSDDDFKYEADYWDQLEDGEATCSILCTEIEDDRELYFEIRIENDRDVRVSAQLDSGFIEDILLYRYNSDANRFIAYRSNAGTYNVRDTIFFEDDYFFATNRGESILYEVRDIDYNDNEVYLRNVASQTTVAVDPGSTIPGSVMTVMDVQPDFFNASRASSTLVYLEENLGVSFSTTQQKALVDVSIFEGSPDDWSTIVQLEAVLNEQNEWALELIDIFGYGQPNDPRGALTSDSGEFVVEHDDDYTRFTFYKTTTSSGSSSGGSGSN